uniref:NADH-ubiquinone oxidoreductase chain 2 n=1 Tax=Deronectes costipennis TaxID=158748 RepID=A0A894K0A6_9DYTI|nr:NADH dehydrogenase subunit 2 [Deronectes costipennis]
MHLIYKIIFMTTLFMGTMITISSYSWMGTWMGLEINLLSFIPLISSKNNSFSSESSIKYFLIQAIASSIFLLTIILIMTKNKMISDTFLINKMLLIMLNSTIMMKLGAAPFHFWFPEIMEKLNWINGMILLTWQKIAPLIILSYTIKSNLFLLMIIISCTFIGSIGGLNQINLKKIMTYSSINHIGWMLSTFLINEMMWIMYFLIYSFISLTIILIFNKYNLSFLKQMYSLSNKNFLMKFFFNLNLLSLGGLPPFLGFLPKWLIIQNLSINYFSLTLFMIMMTLITLFFYLRISYSSMMMNNNEMNFNMMINTKNFNNKTMNLMTFFSINGMVLYTIIMNFN